MQYTLVTLCDFLLIKNITTKLNNAVSHSIWAFNLQICYLLKFTPVPDKGAPKQED